jgi:hypothetical protein
MNDGYATGSKRLLSAKLLTGLAVAGVLVIGAIAAPAFARDDHHDRGHGWHDGGGWHGGGYAGPPVVYGSPYYAPPPVIYGPGIGINLPGVAIGIR